MVVMFYKDRFFMNTVWLIVLLIKAPPQIALFPLFSAVWMIMHVRYNSGFLSWSGVVQGKIRMEMKKTGCEKSKYWLAMKLQNIYVDYGFDLIESHNAFWKYELL